MTPKTNQLFSLYFCQYSNCFAANGCPEHVFVDFVHDGKPPVSSGSPDVGAPLILPSLRSHPTVYQSSFILIQTHTTVTDMCLKAQKKRKLSLVFRIYSIISSGKFCFFSCTWIISLFQFFLQTIFMLH